MKRKRLKWKWWKKAKNSKIGENLRGTMLLILLNGWVIFFLSLGKQQENKRLLQETRITSPLDPQENQPFAKKTLSKIDYSKSVLYQETMVKQYYKERNEGSRGRKIDEKKDQKAEDSSKFVIIY